MSVCLEIMAVMSTLAVGISSVHISVSVIRDTAETDTPATVRNTLTTSRVCLCCVHTSVCLCVQT